jgi:hypothetical protein
LRDEALQPLNLRAQLVEDAARFLRDGDDLFRSYASDVWNVALDDVLGHVSSFCLEASSFGEASREKDFRASGGQIAIAPWERYIGANEEIERQFVSPGGVFTPAHAVLISLRFGDRCPIADCGGHHGGGQGHSAEIAAS